MAVGCTQRACPLPSSVVVNGPAAMYVMLVTSLKRRRVAAATRRIEDCARLASNAARPPNHALQCTAPRCLALLCTVLHLPQPIPGTEFSSPAMKQIESKFKTTAHLLLAPACIVQARLRCSERLYSLSASAAERCHTHIESSGVTTTGCMARPAEADVRMKKKYVLAAVRAMCAYAHTCAL